MGIPRHEQNLLLGLIALRMNFISREQFLAAARAWCGNKSAGLDAILQQQGTLSPQQQVAVRDVFSAEGKGDGLSTRQIVALISSHDSLQEALRLVDDPDINATLDHIANESSEFGSETCSFRPLATANQPRFRVLRPHAHGGLGSVSVACDNELNREVALKEMRAKFADDPNSRQRFLQEAEITGRLEHPSIVPVYSLGKFDDGRPYYVMRFIRGDSLQQAIASMPDPAQGGAAARQWRLELHRLVGRLVDVCHAIAYSHSRGILHRDIKPGNIMLGKYGETLVVDWGLAKVLGEVDTFVLSEGPLRPNSGEGSSETVMGTVVGTPAFMSPEQADGRLDILGPATDVYSLGATLYGILTKQTPFRAGLKEDVLSRVRRGEFLAPRAANRRVPRALEAICLKAMSLDWQARYHSCQQLADDLERWLADEPVSVYREGFIDRGFRVIRHHKAAFFSMCLLFLTVISGLAAYSRVVTRMNADLRVARDEATENRSRAETERARAEANLATSRTLAVDLLNLAENELSKTKGKEALRRDMTSRSVKLFRDFHKQKIEDPQVRRQLAQVIRIEANVARAMGNSAGSLALYDESIQLLEGLLRENAGDTLVRDRLAETLRDQANAFKLRGQIDQAALTFGRARELAAELVKGSPTDHNYRRTLATVDHDQAELLAILGQKDNALRRLQAGAAAFQELVDSNSKHTADPLLLLLARAGEAELLLTLNRYDEAEPALSAALQMARRRSAAGPEKNTQYLLGRLLTAYARLRRQAPNANESPAALFDEAITVLQKVVSDFPTTMIYPRYLANALNARGEWHLSQQDAKAAAADFERARKGVAALAARDDADIADIEALAETLSNQAAALVAGGDAKQAAAKLTEALQHYQRILDRAPSHVIAQQKREALKQRLNELADG